jgi:homoserine dehydrogenase
LALSQPERLDRTVRIAGALVRDPASRVRPDAVPLTTAGLTLLDARPDLVVEVLGGLEPARTLVLDALNRGIPVVTANKSLLAHHGEELFETAARAGVPLRYEAAVIAGVPFLGTFARRPLASAISSITGIVNGTTNFIPSQLQQDEAVSAPRWNRPSTAASLNPTLEGCGWR